MTKQFIASIAILGLVGMLVGVAVLAAAEQSVTATVTPQVLSVTVSPTSIDYGILDVSTATTSSEITATNNGNVTEKFNIRGSNSTNWTLSTASIGTDVFMHEFSTDVGYTTWAPLATTTYATLAPSIATSNSDLFKLKFKMPSVTTATSTQTTTVTVQATAV